MGQNPVSTTERHLCANILVEKIAVADRSTVHEQFYALIVQLKATILLKESRADCDNGAGLVHYYDLQLDGRTAICQFHLWSLCQRSELQYSIHGKGE
jgi:hypothetical protein